MTVLDDRLVPKAKQLIEKYGLNAIFAEFAGFSYDETTGIGAASGQTKTFKITPPTSYDIFFIDGDLIQSGDARVFFAALDCPIVPKIGMKLIIGNDHWRVISFSPIRTGEQIAVYEVQLRK